MLFLCVLNGSYMVRYPFYVLYNLYLAKEDQLFPGLGIYSGIFAIYVQCRSPESRTTTIVFYALCLLYVLSTVAVVSDLIALILEVSNNSICNNIFFFISYAEPSQHTTSSTSPS